MLEITWALTHFGYIALFFLLALGIVGLPIPDETIMVFVGSLTVEGPFGYVPAFAVCLAGSMTGMTVSYIVGRRVGKPLLNRYGKRVKLTPARVERTERWFQRFGPWAIVFGYFVPGLRHLTCYLAGMARMNWSLYFFAAGTGALIWVATFLTIGHFVGVHWEAAVHWIHTKGTLYMVCLAVMLLLIGSLVFVLIRRRVRPKQTP